MSNTPSDAELAAFTDAFDWDGWIAPALAKRAFARAVLAKWGAPQPVAKPWGCFVEGRVFVGNPPEHVRKLAEADGWEIHWLYTAPQPVVREPLSVQEVEQLLAQWSYELHGDRARYLVRMTEQVHGIKQNGGS